MQLKSHNIFQLSFTLLITLMLNTMTLVTSVTPLGGLPQYNNDYGELTDMEFRIAVSPGKEECFFQDAKLNHNLEISYHVTEMSSRFDWMYVPSGLKDLTVDFTLRSPTGGDIIREFRRQEGSHVHLVKDQGVFTICLDNRHSTVSTKVVNIEIYLYSNDDDDRWGNLDPRGGFTFPPEVQYSATVESIKSSINKVRDDLIRVSHEQEQRRAIETRDRNIAEQNYDYVNRFSMLSIGVMFTVGFVQIYMIRSLFESKSYIKKLFKGY